MESQDFNNKLIDYLYGEMSADEKKEFEARLTEDPELQKELETLQSTREDLSQLEDKEVMEPFSIWGHTKSGWMGNNNNKRAIMLRPITAIAASLIILMVVGFATDFSLRINKEGFQMGFHKTEGSSNKPSITEDDVKRILAQEIEKNNEQIFANLHQTQNTINSKLASLEAVADQSKNTNNQSITSNDLNEFFVNVQSKNAKLLEDYLNQSSQQQQQYFKTMLTQFNEYLQEQRTEDLNFVQSEILQVKYSQKQQKNETDQVLAGLISTVSQSQN